MTTTQDATDAAARDAARREIIELLDGLSLEQLREVLGYLNQLKGLPRGISGKEFVDLMQALRDKYQITDEEAEEFDRILREGMPAGRLYQLLSVLPPEGGPDEERPEDAKPPETGGTAFVERMRALRDEFHVTDEEFAEFDRILREHDQAEKRRLASHPHE